MTVCALPSKHLQTIPTETPAADASIAARKPAPPLLGGYTFGCHSLRHLIGGFRDELAKSTSSYRAYACVTCLNQRHMLWAWLSLSWVGFSDLYVRLCSMGIWHDFRIL